MKWQGLQSVVCKIGLVMYEIHHPDKGKATQIYHINLLNAWKGPPSNPSTLLLIRKVEEDQEEDQPDPKARRPADPAVPLVVPSKAWVDQPSTTPYPPSSSNTIPISAVSSA